MTDKSPPLNSLAITKELLRQKGEWVMFHEQLKGTENTVTGDRYARNRANGYRIYVKRKGYPIEIQALRHTDGLIRAWARWNEGEAPSTRPPE